MSAQVSQLPIVFIRGAYHPLKPAVGPLLPTSQGHEFLIFWPSNTPFSVGLLPCIANAEGPMSTLVGVADKVTGFSRQPIKLQVGSRFGLFVVVFCFLSCLW